MNNYYVTLKAWCSRSCRERSWARLVNGLIVLSGCIVIVLIVPAMFSAVAAFANESNEAPTIGDPHVDAHSTRALFVANIQPNGAPAKWEIKYATSEGQLKNGLGVVAAEGTSLPGQTVAVGEVHHLTSSTKYFAEFKAVNKYGHAKEEYGPEKTEILPFETLPVAPPEILNVRPVNIGINYADFEATIESNGADTEYMFEYAKSESNPAWIVAPGTPRTVTKVEDVIPQDDKLPGDLLLPPAEAQIEGLEPKTKYLLKVSVFNEACGKGGRECASVTEEFETRTDLPDEPAIEHITEVGDSSAHIAANVDPRSFETHWHLEYGTSKSALEKGEGSVGPEGTVTAVEADELPHLLAGDLVGLTESTVYFVRLVATNQNGTSASSPVSFETAGAPRVTTFPVHAIHGESMRVLGGVEPHSYDTHYHFEYVAKKRFEEDEWAGASTTKEEDVGSGQFVESEGGGHFPVYIVAQDLTGLSVGESYRFRLVASSVKGTVDGADQVLVVPEVPKDSVGKSSACGNEAVRSGPSAGLFDCRAYEQITPVNKEGAKEIDNYSAVAETGVVVGEDGSHVMLHNDSVNWGAAPGDGQSPYFFSRSRGGWDMIAAAIEPQSGVSRDVPQVYDRNLSQFGFESGYETTETKKSANIEFGVGPPGGAYAVAGSASRSHAGEGWVAASEDFSKLILQPVSKGDLFEWFGGVSREIPAVGSCGERVANEAGKPGETTSSRHSVSSDGSLVFFEAVPGSNCAAASHLYVRVDGRETTDIGEYTFMGANPDGTEVLLEKITGQGTREISLYESATKSLKLLFAASHILERVRVSEDLSAFYFRSSERLNAEAPPMVEGNPEGASLMDLYRYDVALGKLSFVAQTAAADHTVVEFLSPDGRFYEWTASEVVGVPAGLPGLEVVPDRNQVYRFDSVENVLECMSCASSFDPQPRLGSTFGDYGASEGREYQRDGLPGLSVGSADGKFAFFSTPAALVPQDIDGEEAPEDSAKREPTGEYVTLEYTGLSSDIYEWRAVGVDGCVHIQGCLSLITSGTGGYLNLFVGTTRTGGDVFFMSASRLVSADNDTALDIYDARVGGGFQQPVRPPECEGDACQSPVAVPIDTTPASLTFSSAPNPTTTAKPKPLVKRCGKGMVRVKSRCVKKKSKSRRAARKIRRGKHSSQRVRRGGRK